MSSYLRPFWRYPLFQIPVTFLIVFLLTALLFWLLGIGRPKVAVAIAIDLSPSTYPMGQFLQPGTIVHQEIQAVEAYLEKNNSGILRQPNLITVIGFADIPKQLTRDFQTEGDLITKELNQAVNNPKLIKNLGGGTDLNLAIQEATRLLSTISDRCRELLIVTDGQADVSSERINEAITERIRINAIVIGAEVPQIQNAATATGGIYMTIPKDEDLEQLFTERFFQDFNQNWPWIIFWLGLAWMALMWTITMPLDRWLLQGLFKLRFNLAGRLALSNALFWTVATPGILIGIYRLLDLVLPFVSAC